MINMIVLFQYMLLLNVVKIDGDKLCGSFALLAAIVVFDIIVLACIVIWLISLTF